MTAIAFIVCISSWVEQFLTHLFVSKYLRCVGLVLVLTANTVFAVADRTGKISGQVSGKAVPKLKRPASEGG
jgi:hypothetical protein